MTTFSEQFDRSAILGTTKNPNPMATNPRLRLEPYSDMMTDGRMWISLATHEFYWQPRDQTFTLEQENRIREIFRETIREMIKPLGL